MVVVETSFGVVLDTRIVHAWICRTSVGLLLSSLDYISHEIGRRKRLEVLLNRTRDSSETN